MSAPMLQVTDLTKRYGGLVANSDIDFNSDGLFPDTDDIAALIRVFGGGACL